MKFSTISTDALLLLAATSSTWMMDTSFGFVVTTPTTNSRVPSTAQQSGIGIGRSLSLERLSFKKSGADKEVESNDLSTLDEEILFGDAPTSPSIPFPSPTRRRTRTGNLLPSTNPPTNPLDHSQTNPLINKLNSVRQVLTSCPQIWTLLAKYTPDKRALLDTHLCDVDVDLTFAQAEEMVRRSAGMFRGLGVGEGDRVTVLGENSAYWLMVDHGIQTLGGVSAVRGADAPVEELRYIYDHSQSVGVVVLQGPRLFDKLRADAVDKGREYLGLENEVGGKATKVVLMHREKKSDEDIRNMAEEAGMEVVVFRDMVDTTEPIKEGDAPEVGKEDLATIVYTSGTTGQPKGVMLTHGNLIHQIGHRLFPSRRYDETEPIPGELMLSLLPVWHITERTFELWMLSRGCSVVYSTIISFKKDLAKYQPQWMVLVPRVLEKVALGVQGKFADGSAVSKNIVKLVTATGTMRSYHSKVVDGLVVGDNAPGRLAKLKSKAILTTLAPVNALGDKLVWSKVKDGFGGKIKVIISGGSALAGSLESFYETCGLKISVGYGLTECSPLISHRRVDRNLVTPGCVGQPCLDTELRVVDPEVKPEDVKGERPALPDGEVGVVIARGPQIMKGYYRNAEATAKAIDKFGFFDTGDLGKINPATGDLILTGRCKDTIVLSNGENIEPSPIEDAILSQSPLIEQVMLVGDDGKSLTAIVVLNPNELSVAGFVDKKMGKALQKQNESVNDPKCAEKDCNDACDALSQASETLRADASLQSVLVADVRTATKGFRKWEQVKNVYITLEPFAMSNGQLTQSYKVKRDAVSNRYLDELS